MVSAQKNPPRGGGNSRVGPIDVNRFALGLQDDSTLYRVKLGAGVMSVVALVAMLVTSLSRAPSIASTVVLAVLAIGLSVKIGVGVLRRHRAGSSLSPGG